MKRLLYIGGTVILAGLLYGSSRTRGTGTLHPASPFGEHMVLQHDRARLWGSSLPGEPITISLQKTTTTTTAGPKGKWRAVLPPLKTGGPYTLRLSTPSDSITWRNILVGEVLVAAGQSNMAWPLKDTLEAQETLKQFPQRRIRLLAPAYRIANHPLQEYEGTWTEASLEAAAEFSAVALQAGLTLQERLNVPIGLIDISIPGSDIRAWMAPESIRNSMLYLGEAAQLDRWAGPAHAPRPLERIDLTNLDPSAAPFYREDTPCGVYNGMVHPLVGLGIRSFLWYQGEDNVEDHFAYPFMARQLITDWRSAWGDGAETLPFMYVELPGFPGGDKDWARFRLSQQRMEELIPSAFMVPASDLGAKSSIHPLKKKELGERLAKTLLAAAFQTKDDVHGPRVKTVRKTDRGVEVIFDEPIQAYTNPANHTVEGFYLADETETYYPAMVQVGEDRVLVQRPEIADPRKVTYNCKGMPYRSITDTQGLPAYCFRISLPE